MSWARRWMTGTTSGESRKPHKCFRMAEGTELLPEEEEEESLLNLVGLMNGSAVRRR